MNKLIIIDDEPSILISLRYSLNNNYEVFTAKNSQEGMEIIEEERPDLVLLDLKLGNENGIDVLGDILQRWPEQVVIIITAFGTIETTIKAIKEGAFYYLTKPIDLSELKIIVDNGIEVAKLRKQVKTLSQEIDFHKGPEGIVGRSRAMRNVFSIIEEVKDLEASVLITGATGTGKELVARAIHRWGARSEKPFTVINCAAIPSNLLESELFGYVKGAYTGAEQDYQGKILKANGGIIFFDEIGEMDISLQAKVLRFLEDKKVSPIGSNEEKIADVRILAATNCDLEEASKKGTFRKDLYYRLNVINIELPKLVDRQEDIPILAQYFIEEFCPNDKEITISPEALKILQEHSYPGNVRELKHLIERCVIFSRTNEITSSDILKYQNFQTPQKTNKMVKVLVGDKLVEVEKKLIYATLEETRGHRINAAKILGITDRTLRNKLKGYRDSEKKSE